MNLPGGWAGSRRALFVRAALLLGVLAVASLGMYRTDTGRVVVRAAADFAALHRVQAYVDEIRFASNESLVEPELLAAVMFCESSGRVSARSPKDALGLFQLRISTARERALVLGLPEPTEEDLLSDPMLNARLGADYFSWLLDRQGGDVERALIAYNAGPTRLARWVDEAGDYATWRAGRVAAGNSGVLAYAAKVERYRRQFREMGLFDPDAEYTDRPHVR